MRRRLILALVAGLAVAAAGVFAVVAFTGLARAQRLGAQTSTTADSTSATDPMQTITPYQLQWMHLFLGPAPSAVAVSSAQADQAVEARGAFPDNAGPIRETVLATCSMTPQPTSESLAWANRPCWVVSLTPGEVRLFGPGVPENSPAPSHPSMVQTTVAYALVDANTGEVFDEAAGTPAPQAPTS